ncbi:MAG: DNA polymerase Y family protein [Gammaproteobacteria bacterium]|nr:DNA polymerase Y family protein [Gammaproteobacteria bacterium]
MLWLALHFPMLGLEERLDTFDGSATEPAVLVEDNRVVQANEGAQQAEIVLGSTLATANSILPALNHFNRDPAAEHERLSWLAQMAYRYTPRVSPAPPDALLLEVRGSLRLFGGMKALVDKVAADCRRCGHEQSWAVATTPLAALMLARAGMGIVVEQPVRTALNGVPLVHGDLPPKDLERLANMGITRVDELLGLPGRELGKRFGPALIDYLARLTGQKADPRAFIEPSEQFHSSIHLLEPVRGKDALLFPMRRLATELARWLARRSFGTRRLTWTIKPLSGTAAVLTIEFAQPRRDDLSFLNLSKLKLTSADLPEEVMSVSLRADFIAPFENALADLWGMTAGKTATPAELVDLLAAKLGGDAVRDLRTLDDHRPEYAWRTDQAGARTVRASGSGPAMGHSRPLWLLDPPKPVDAGLFELVSGPERIETGWWNATAARSPENSLCEFSRKNATAARILPEERDRCVVGSASRFLRDYYVAYSKQGARCWLYRDQNENWFLHGYFS